MATQAQTAGRSGVQFKTVAAVLAGGVLGLLVWEVLARTAFPPLVNGPIGLAQTVLGKFGVWETLEIARPDRRPIAEALHYATGLIFYPLAYVVVARPIARAFPWPLSGWATVGAVYGAGLFLFAGYAMGHLIAGFPPLFGWAGVLERFFAGDVGLGAVTGHLGFMSFVGHVGVGLGIAFAVRQTLGE